jgi:uncharacterized protein YndB with AHSA1/START domain
MKDIAKVIAPDTVVLTRVFPGPIERLWSYLVDPKKRAQWFAGGPMELAPGGKMELFFQHNNLTDEPAPEKYKAAATGVKSPGTITRCEPPNALGFTWGEGAEASEVLFELREQGNDVVLVLTHSRLAGRAEMVNVGSGWHLHLLVLDDLLRGKPRRPFWTTQAQLERQYDEQLPR